MTTILNILFQTYIVGDSQNGIVCDLCDRYPGGEGALMAAVIVIGGLALAISALRTPSCGGQVFALIVGTILVSLMLTLGEATQATAPTQPQQHAAPVVPPSNQVQIQDLGGGQYRYWFPGDNTPYCAPGRLVNGQVEIVTNMYVPCN